MRVNLIPASVRRRQAQHRRLRAWGVVVSIAFVMLMIPIGLDWSRRATAKQLHETLSHLEASYQIAQTEWNSVHLQVEETQAHIERADALRSKRNWSAMVTMIAANVPRDAWLTTIATDPAQPAITKPSARTGIAPADPQDAPALTIDAPTTIKIEGFAPRAVEPFSLVRNLQATNVFKSVSLLRSSLEQRDDGAYFHFNLVCEW